MPHNAWLSGYGAAEDIERSFFVITIICSVRVIVSALSAGCTHGYCYIKMKEGAEVGKPSN